MNLTTKDYLATLSKRAKETRAYTPHQAAGTEIAEILDDEKHIALYIKLAKDYDSSRLIALAKDVASRKDVKNRGAYFMRVWQIKRHENSHDRKQEK
jgi:hypothetical protein